MPKRFIISGQQGQTLIETIAAIFILVTALTAGLALAIYVFANSDRAFNELVASNLASEGIDVVKNMRDTNWLESDAKGGPWDLTNCSIGSNSFQCYPRAWEGVPGGAFHNYGLFSDGNFFASFNDEANTWSLDSSPSSYALYQQADGSYTSTGSGATPIYVRKIILAHNTSAPFAAGDLSELVVTSIVGWSGRGCTPMTSGDPATTSCNVAITERLSNWKDYK